jgi:hypothetical protein
VVVVGVVVDVEFGAVLGIRSDLVAVLIPKHVVQSAEEIEEDIDLLVG